MQIIAFKTKVVNAGNVNIIKLDSNSSSKLTSRGLVMVKGTINNFPFQSTLEPDGKGSHWFAIDNHMLKELQIRPGDRVTLSFKQVNEWVEPKVPRDVKKILFAEHKSYNTWLDITPLARWEWIRWIGSTNNPITRKRRIDVALSKLRSGDRRPCCFNSNQCTTPELSKKGVLIY